MNRDDRPTIAERVGKALSRGNMRQREGYCELDVIGALGMVGIRERLSDAVYRLKYANDARSYSDALQGVYNLARSMDQRNRWRVRRPRMRWMARRVLDYWLNDGCHTCTGLGYEIAPGTPHLSDRPCRECHGSRKKVMPWIKRIPKEPEGRKATRAYKLRWREVVDLLVRDAARHRGLLVELENIERGLANKMLARLAA